MKRSISMFLVSVCAAFCVVAEEPQVKTDAVAGDGPILFGPYIQKVESGEATVVWVTQGDKVTLEGGEQTIDRSDYRVHTVRFDRLKPDTKYTYKLGSGLSGSFKTAPGKAAKFRFVVYGDTRSREEEHQKVVDGMRKQGELAFVINTGDLVSSGSNLDHWKSFFKVAGPLMAETYYVPCLGNHEDNAKEYFDFFVLPNDEYWYSFNWGGVHFVALNTEPMAIPDGMPASAETELYSSRQMWEYFAKQREWFEKDLQDNQFADFIVVYFHVPMYDSKTSRRENQYEIRKAFGDIIDKYRVELVLNGHTHNYQHYRKGLTHYVITGGGGAPIYDIEEGAGVEGVETIRQEQSTHYCVVDVEGSRLKLHSYFPDGTSIEEFSVESQGGLRRVDERLKAIGGLPWEKEQAPAK
jgi:hypothetical protein